jgi:creatinine amidohydrolase/Fe(II)-dependent formamide hydrolase-like protein
METTKEAYQQKLQAQLEEWRARVAVLEAKVAKADDATKGVLNEHAGEIAKLQETAKQTFEEFKAASVETWTDVRTKWSQVSDAMEKLWSKAS